MTKAMEPRLDANHSPTESSTPFPPSRTSCGPPCVISTPTGGMVFQRRSRPASLLIANAGPRAVTGLPQIRTPSMVTDSLMSRVALLSRFLHATGSASMTVSWLPGSRSGSAPAARPARH